MNTIPTPATKPSTKAAFRRRCQQALDNQEMLTLYAPHCANGSPRMVKAVRSADIIMLMVEASDPLIKHERVVTPDGRVLSEESTQIAPARPAGKESYLSFGKIGRVANDGPVWTIAFDLGRIGLSMTYVFPS